MPLLPIVMMVLGLASIVACIIISIPSLRVEAKPYEPRAKKTTQTLDDDWGLSLEKGPKKKTTGSVLLGVIVIAGIWWIITFIANGSKMSLSEFNEIKNGMTYEQVCDIVGSEGELLSDLDLGIGSAYASQIYMWEGVGWTGANANVTFQGGVVVMKAQFGLT